MLILSPNHGTLRLSNDDDDDDDGGTKRLIGLDATAADLLRVHASEHSH